MARKPQSRGSSLRTRTFRVNRIGRDLVVGDVHGCFRTLDHALRELNFDARCDRLFGVGDLVNRGPHSSDAIDWLQDQFTAVALGNHDRAILDWFAQTRRRSPPGWAGWLGAVRRSAHSQWKAALRDMPVAITIETAFGFVGIVHAEAPNRVWRSCIALLDSGDTKAVDDALFGFEVPGQGVEAVSKAVVEGLRALVHGHFPVAAVEQVANRWNIDTGAGIPGRNRLTVIEINQAALAHWTFDVREGISLAC